MNIEYEEVPNMISCKDLDYLSDMFQWNYGAYKCSYNASNNVGDEEIKDILEKNNIISNFKNVEIYQTLTETERRNAKIKVNKLYGNNGELNQKEVINMQKILTNSKM